MSAEPRTPDLTADHPSSQAEYGRVGPYRLLDRLGEGGMGTVYLAEQTEPVRRHVALKVIKPGMDSAQVVARFEAERQALAMMDHVNIARVLDAGTTDRGLPYFVMELVRGVPITKFCDDARLTVRERLELFVQVCRAVQHAHQKGVLHRDLKPSNVLVAESDGKPVPKVIDFGVAKATQQSLTEKTMYTQVGGVVGTWEYMSPEQAEASPLGVDTRTDVYSLGVLLYELLTGTTPLDRRRLREGGFSEMIREIREVDPPRPSARLSADTPAVVAAARRVEPPGRLARLVRGDLDWVVMKALAKNRAERYESASGLARDVERYLAGEPVEAHPPSAAYRARRFLRRNKGAVAAAAAFVLLLVAGVVASAWQASVAKSERDRAVAAREELRAVLTRQVADRMQADLERLTAVGEALGNTVEYGQDWDEARLVAWMRRMIDVDPKILGLCIAFEPGTYEPPLDPATDRKPFAAVVPFGFDEADSIRDGYSLYVWRDPEKAPHLAAAALWRQYRYRTRFWYRDTLAGRAAGWTEPNFDLYAVGMPMVSHTAPIRRGGRPIGVLTVDLSLDYFRRLESDLNNPNFGKDSYGFVLSGTGRVVSHPRLGPNPLGRKHGEMSPHLHEVYTDPAFGELLARIVAHKSDDVGQATGIDPATNRPSRFLYAKFKPAGWVFVAVIPEDAK